MTILSFSWKVALPTVFKSVYSNKPVDKKTINYENVNILLFTFLATNYAHW